MIAHINAVTGQKQSVQEHCKNTAAIAEYFGQKMGIENLAYLAGIIHDCGKYTEQFKLYLEKAVTDKNSVRKGEINHSSSGAILIYEDFYKGDEIHRLTAQILMNAVFDHHGLYDIISPEGKDITNAKILKKEQINYEEAISNYLHNVVTLEELESRFETAVVEVEHITFTINGLIQDYKEDKEKYVAKDFYYSCLQRLVLSQLIDADRLDTATFCGDRQATHIEDNNYIIGLWDELYNKLDQYLQKFKGTDKISQYRKKISDDCFAFSHNAKGIYRLMVPTGGGKTLASLRFAISHAKEKKLEHIYYIAPYMSILDQNADVIKKIFHRDDVILEHHSNVINESEDETEEWRHLTENWDCPIILTTMVQLLNTLFDGRTQCIRRMHNLTNSIIIFDEIQSIPAKCIHTFNLAVNFLHYICGSTIILCSATQPLLDSEVQYKLLLSNPAGIIQDTDELYKKFQRVHIDNKMIPGCYDANKLSDMIMEIMSESLNVLTILNTKRAVLKLYQAVKEQNNILPEGERARVILLTTNMCPKHRLALIDEIKDKLKREERLICISTSLIEAGVDISFKHVVRSLAGLDSIAQAAGRCNRNGEYEIGTVTIINSIDENLGRLPEIKKAQNATEPILRKYSSEPEYFSGDPLSPFALDNFYKRYFPAIQEEMNYRIKDRNTNLLDLLSVNGTGVRAYITNTQEYPKMVLNQAFKTAGSEFEVIVKNTTGVLVPYDEEAIELINILNGASTIEEVKKALRKVQAYTVNLYKQDFDRLCAMGTIKPLLNYGIYVMAEGFYSAETGVTEETNLDYLEA